MEVLTPVTDLQKAVHDLAEGCWSIKWSLLKLELHLQRGSELFPSAIKLSLKLNI